MNTLDKNFMISSYRNISFRGEERGEYDFNYYSDMLKKDLELLGENKGKYEQKFCEKVMAIYGAKSRQASSMIVGPAKFKVTHKANEAERKHFDHFAKWRERYFKLVNRVRKKSPAEYIEDHKNEISRLEEVKAKRKEEGRCYRNITIRIKYYKDKIEQMEAREKLSENFSEIAIPDGKIYFANDRLVVEHTNKPSSEVISIIKKHGFRYSPKTKSWVRQFTGNAVYSAKQLANKLNS